MMLLLYLREERPMGLIRFVQKHNENVHHREANELKRRELLIIQQQQEEIARLRQQQTRMTQTNNQENRFCGNCGNSVNATSKFCNNCGSQL